MDALFRDAGVVRTETLEEMFDVAALLGSPAAAAGHRVAILTNAGGPGILAADACEARGLVLPRLASDTVQALRSFLPAAASIGNPVDMLATAPADHYRRAIPLLLADPAVDSLLTIFIPPLVTDTGDAARAIAEAARDAQSRCSPHSLAPPASLICWRDSVLRVPRIRRARTRTRRRIRAVAGPPHGRAVHV